jgi:ribokinase
MQASIVVVGSLNMDLVIRTAHLPAPGETLFGSGFATAPGGKGANQAVAAARLGAAVAMVGRTGSDDYGRALRADLKAAGVDTSHVSEDRAAATGVALITVEEGGQNTIVVASGANMRVSRADVDEAESVLRAAHGLIVQLEVPLDVVEYSMRQARQAGLVVVLNPAPAQVLSREFRALADVLVPNESEASILTGLTITDAESAEAAARVLSPDGVPAVVVTLGVQGALLWQKDSATFVPPFAVQAVDATAAGDAFVGALTTALLRAPRGEALSSASLRLALREASAAGALTATKPGAQPSLPTRAELDRFLRDHTP